MTKGKSRSRKKEEGASRCLLKRKLDLDKGKLTKKENYQASRVLRIHMPGNFLETSFFKDEHKMLAPCRMTQGFRADQAGQKTRMLVH
jgi:hypothetical protein